MFENELDSNIPEMLECDVETKVKERNMKKTSQKSTIKNVKNLKICTFFFTEKG